MSLQDFFDRQRPRFQTGQRLGALRPLFEAIEFFALTPGARTKVAPHVRDPLDLKRYMSMVIIGLLPAVAAGLYFFGLRVLAVIAVSYIVGGTIEVLFAIARKEDVNEGFFVTGLLFPLILPPTLPLWMVAVGVAFGVIVGKELFGGTGRNLFNPALVGRCFLAIAYPHAMAQYLKPGGEMPGRLFQYASAANADAVTSATPLGMAKRGEITPYADMFWGHVSGSIGETSAVLLLAGGIFLLLTKVGNYRSTVSMLVSFFALQGLLHLAAPGRFVEPFWHLLAGGLMIGAFFMATDPVTGPVTNPAKWAYGTLIGVSTVLIRNLTGYVEGVMFSILLGNIFAPLLDEVVIRYRHAQLARLDLPVPPVPEETASGVWTDKAPAGPNDGARA